jgi:hypothetical protein
MLTLYPKDDATAAAAAASPRGEVVAEKYEEIVRILVQCLGSSMKLC